MRTALAIIMLFAAVSLSPPTTNAAAFVCEPGFYQVITGSLKKLDPETGNYTEIGSTALYLNAVGYNIEDNYIYGLNNDPGGSTLLRVEDDGSYTDLGAVTGLPTGSVSGDFDHSGNLYVVTDSTTIYSIDVSTLTATAINLSSSVTGVNDLVYINGHLYGTNGTTLYDITISDGTVASKPLGLENVVYGAGWASVDDRLYFSQNANGVIYEIIDYNTNTPTSNAALQGDSGLIGNDGASCSMAPTIILDLNVVDDSYATDFETPIQIASTEGVLQNDIGSNLTVASNTQPQHGTVTLNPDGSFTYTPDSGFAGIDSFNYTATDSVDNTQAGTVTITVAPAMEIPGPPEAGTHATLQKYITLAVLATGVGISIWRRKSGLQPSSKS